MDHVTDVRSAESRCAAEDQGCWEIKGLCLFRIWVKRFLISTAALFFFCTNWSGLLTLWPDTRVTRTLKYDRLVSTFRHVEFKCWTNRRHRTSESFWPRPHLCLCLCLCMYQSQLVIISITTWLQSEWMELLWRCWRVTRGRSSTHHPLTSAVSVVSLVASLPVWMFIICGQKFFFLVSI